MGRKPQVQTRLAQNNYERFEHFRDSNDISNAEAARQLIVAGLDAKRVTTEEIAGPADRIAQQASTERIAYLALLLAAFFAGTAVPL